jgi:hypothetical protein
VPQKHRLRQGPFGLHFLYIVVSNVVRYVSISVLQLPLSMYYLYVQSNKRIYVLSFFQIKSLPVVTPYFCLDLQNYPTDIDTSFLNIYIDSRRGLYVYNMYN